MIAIVLLLLSQVPCAPGVDSTLVCQCKQGVASACELLDPKVAAAVEKALQSAKAMAELELARQKAAETADSQAQVGADAPEPPDCKGQEHHIISRPIAEALKDHPTLGGRYKPRDPRFVAKAKDEAAHCGYQDWHRKVDKEVIDWLDGNRKATPEQFLQKLREIYSRLEMRAKIPNGF